jgi:O-acetylhomoserine (thiol)-lyase
MTKFLGGHGNSMGGVLVEGGKFDWTKTPKKYPTMTEPTPSYHGLRFYETFGNMAFAVAARAVSLRDLGPTISPMNSFLILTGIETLALRMERHCENALKVAQFLSKHKKVSWVSYAGLANDRYYKLAKKYVPKGAGSVFTFGVKGGYEAGIKLVENVEIFSHLANIGDTRSLIIHPASTTHRQLTPEQLKAAGAGPDVVRLSIGLENVEDIIRDLDQALRKA